MEIPGSQYVSRANMPEDTCYQILYEYIITPVKISSNDQGYALYTIDIMHVRFYDHSKNSNTCCVYAKPYTEAQRFLFLRLIV